MQFLVGGNRFHVCGGEPLVVGGELLEYHLLVGGSVGEVIKVPVNIIGQDRRFDVGEDNMFPAGGFFVLSNWLAHGGIGAYKLGGAWVGEALALAGFVGLEEGFIPL